MSRFLRYHPINEFEPFFESLGLKHPEYTPLLPRDLMFLSDDCLFLENSRVLCEFGIERKKIGQIYKKAVQVFQLDFGVLPLKLQAYRELGLSQSFMVKVIVCSPYLLIGDVHMKFIKALEIIKSAGFDYVWIEEHLPEKESCNWNMIFGVLSIFRESCCSREERFDCIANAGLEKEDVSKMVGASPQILNQSKAVIQSKLDILVKELGFPLSSLILFPSYLSYTTQRVRLRLAMYNWLKDEEKVEPDLALSTLVSCSDKLFLGRSWIGFVHSDLLVACLDGFVSTCGTEW
ncbi:hypothetical protein V6N13_110385 [Hibiscus sabdariffa]|uniref:Uncharacterized protein n=1 Tax=Hibiscus sabdariffa TaxID=183260 RepID=A0ABR2THU8_9ROSI